MRGGSYVPIFIIAASAYLAALLVIHLLSPKLDPLSFNIAPYEPSCG